MQISIKANNHLLDFDKFSQDLRTVICNTTIYFTYGQ